MNNIGLGMYEQPTLSISGSIYNEILLPTTENKHFYALNVGIDTYEDSGNKDFGAANDASGLSSALATHGIHSTVLIDDNATLNNFSQWWENVIDKIQTGDIVFFSYSGLANHANKIRFYHSNEYISDEELMELFDRVAKKGGIVFSLLDGPSLTQSSKILCPHCFLVINSEDTLSVVQIFDGKKHGVLYYAIIALLTEKAGNISTAF